MTATPDTDTLHNWRTRTFDARLSERCDYWRDRLRLNDMRLTYVIDKDIDANNADGEAFYMPEHGNRGKIAFADRLLSDADEDWVEFVVVHEHVHLVTAPLMSYAEFKITGDDAKWLLRLEEQTVSEFASILIGLNADLTEAKAAVAQLTSEIAELKKQRRRK